MKLHKSWIVVADVLWGVLLVAMVVLWGTGAAAWHEALFLLAPFATYLLVRPTLVAATVARPAPPARSRSGAGGSPS